MMMIYNMNISKKSYKKLLQEHEFVNQNDLCFKDCYFTELIKDLLKNFKEYYENLKIEYWVSTKKGIHCYIITCPINHYTYFIFHDFGRNIKLVTTFLQKSHFKNITTYKRYND